MSTNNYQENNYRRKRVQRLKKLIIRLLAIFILIPYVCCIILFFKMDSLDRQVDDLSRQVENLSRYLEQLGSSVETKQGESEAAGKEDAVKKVDEEKEDDLFSGEVSSGTEEDHPAHMVYLTFDDGPSIYTNDILDILDSYGVKATFFVVGKEDDASKEALKRIVEEGHTLGMHSYSHQYKQIYESVDAFAEDFNRIQTLLYDITGVESVYYRFPGGSSNTASSVNMQEFADYLKTQGVTFYDWNSSAGDATSQPISKEALVANSTKGVELRGTSIILMHDSADKYTTVNALPEIIENILAMEDTVILPITEDTKPVQHIHAETE
ncbi:MAG: polysaccharide deacetylase [Lachnoclostridium sp.]|nr:polysaccharide deacetylase [Lachnospira sp.]MCM1247061.1 polysaccharide deacetylase [Lachnoclostridium sp.]MCM1534787.1 polysaccharide deacetylase [Clostridium sp.]